MQIVERTICSLIQLNCCSWKCHMCDCYLYARYSSQAHVHVFTFWRTLIVITANFQLCTISQQRQTLKAFQRLNDEAQRKPRISPSVSAKLQELTSSVSLWKCRFIFGAMQWNLLIHVGKLNHRNSKINCEAIQRENVIQGHPNMNTNITIRSKMTFFLLFHGFQYAPNTCLFKNNI